MRKKKPMPWYRPKTEKFNLPAEHGFDPSYWVELLNPESLPSIKSIELYEMFEKIREAGTSVSAEKLRGAILELLTEYLVDWNLVDADNKKLPLPREDPNILLELPAALIMFIFDKIGELRVRELPPKAQT